MLQKYVFTFHSIAKITSSSVTWFKYSLTPHSGELWRETMQRILLNIEIICSGYYLISIKYKVDTIMARKCPGGYYYSNNNKALFRNKRVLHYLY